MLQVIQIFQTVKLVKRINVKLAIKKNAAVAILCIY